MFGLIRRIAVMIGVASVLGATALLLALSGRTWWCKSGDWTIWAGDIWSPHNSQHLLDPYAPTHVLHGMILFMLVGSFLPGLFKGSRAILAVVLEALWELLENSPAVIERYREATISLDYYGDSIANSITDILACAVGYYLASKIPWKISVGLFFVVELLLILWIRDSLLLNVVMLVHPVPAIKAWQSTIPTL